MLTGLGLSTAWLGGLAALAAPHQRLLLVIAALLLGAGGTSLAIEHLAAQACRMNGICARPSVQLVTLLGLLIGAALLVVGYLYV